MPYRTRAARIYAITGQMILEIGRAIRAAYPELDAEDSLICFAAVVGFSEKRPLSTSKLADYTQIPRTTVIRRVRRLVDLGFLEDGPGKSLLAPQQKVTGTEASKVSNSCARIIQKAAAELSKMDT